MSTPGPGNPDPLAARISVGGARRGGWGKALLVVLVLSALGAAGYYGWQWWAEYNGLAFNIRLENAEGLEAGSPVQISGVKAGHITEVRFGASGTDPERLLPILSIRVRSSFASALRTDLSARVEAPLLMGEPALVINPGSSDASAVRPGVMIDLAPAGSGGVLDRAAKGLRELFSASGEDGAMTEQERERISAKLQTLIEEIQALEARVERLEEAARAEQRAAPSMP